MTTRYSKELREYLRHQNQELAIRADNFWNFSKSIIERQNSPNSNENGFAHVKMVEHNCWRLINESNNLAHFDTHELFILSCCACCHDFDKGLFSETTDNKIHGVGSGDFLIENYKQFQQHFPEVLAIREIIGIHDLPNLKFQEKLNTIDKIFPLSIGTIQLQKLAVILKTADVLHTDNSRVLSFGIDMSKLNDINRKKHLARESIIGWHIDGSRIIFKAVPQKIESQIALEECIEYITKNEWPAIEDKLNDYNFPHKILFEIDSRFCKKPTNEVSKKEYCEANPQTGQKLDKKFVHRKIPGQTFSGYSAEANPYFSLLDATDPYPPKRSTTIYCYLWLPHTQYLLSPNMSMYTPASAICTTNPANIIDSFIKDINSYSIRDYKIAASKLRSHEKMGYIYSISNALKNSFCISAVFPKSLIVSSNKNPVIGYQIMTNMILLPLMEKHKNLNFKKIIIRIPNVGEKTKALIGITKKSANACFPKRGSNSIELSGETKHGITIEKITAFIAWTVSSYYNKTPNQKWIELLENAINN